MILSRLPPRRRRCWIYLSVSPGGASFMDIKKRAVTEASAAPPGAAPSNSRSGGIYVRPPGRDCAPTPRPPDSYLARIPLASLRTYYAARVPACMIIVFLSGISTLVCPRNPRRSVLGSRGERGGGPKERSAISAENAGSS